MTNEGTAAPGETSSGSWGREAVAELRGAVYRAEGEAVLPALRGRPLEPILQKAGDGLLVAVAQGIAGAPEAAARCAELLRERWWEGDEDLAVQLEAALGSGPAPMLRALPVDLEELSMMLEGDPLYGGGRIDLRTGETWPSGTEDVWSEEVGEEDREDDSDPDDLDDAEDRWLYVGVPGLARRLPGHGGLHRDDSPGGPPGHARGGDHRSRSLPPVQGRDRSLARRDRTVARVLRRAPHGQGQGMACGAWVPAGP
jgi:hypothetical protein